MNQIAFGFIVFGAALGSKMGVLLQKGYIVSKAFENSVASAFLVMLVYFAILLVCSLARKKIVIP